MKNIKAVLQFSSLYFFSVLTSFNLLTPYCTFIKFRHCYVSIGWNKKCDFFPRSSFKIFYMSVIIFFNDFDLLVFGRISFTNPTIHHFRLEKELVVFLMVIINCEERNLVFCVSRNYFPMFKELVFLLIHLKAAKFHG